METSPAKDQKRCIFGISPIFAISALLVIGAALIWFFIPKEPKYQGRTLSSWLRQLNDGRDLSSEIKQRPMPELTADQKAAAEAIRKMGTKALPTLLRSIQQHEEPPFRRWLKLQFQKHDLPWIFRMKSTETWHAILGIGVLGTNALTAVPALERMLGENSRNGAAAARALTALGEPGHNVLINALSGSNHSQRVFAIWAIGQKPITNEAVFHPLLNILTNSSFPNHAAWALGRTKLYPELVVPHIIDLLSRTNVLSPLQLLLIESLPTFGQHAAPALPLLLEYLEHPNPSQRMYALKALGILRLRPDICVPAIVAKLDDQDNGTQAIAFSTLEIFGTNAQSAVPALAKLQDSEDPRANLARHTLKAINPDAASQLGIK